MLSTQDELFKRISAGSYQLKKVDEQTKNEYNPLHQSDFQKQLNNRRDSLRHVAAEKRPASAQVMGEVNLDTLRQAMTKRRMDVEVDSPSDSSWDVDQPKIRMTTRQLSRQLSSFEL